MEYLPKTPAPSSLTSWSARLMVVALLGILFLTLFPFRLTAHAAVATNRLPFLLNGWGKSAGTFDAFLNVLLFMPFGFALAERLREQGKSRWVTLVSALASGAALSYGVEFIQLYVPMRDSGWGDVLTNTTGSVAGFALFETCGEAILRLLAACRRAAVDLVAWPRAILTLPAYFILWFAISVPLQMQTRLSNWHPDALLVVGNDVPGEHSTAWRGRLFRLQIWNEPVPRDLARQLATGDANAGSQTGLLADYDFAKPSQLADQRNFLPALVWTNGPPIQADPPYLDLDGRSWLISEKPVSNLIESIRATNRFAIRVVCEPVETKGSAGRIVGIWKRSGPFELRIRQQEDELIIFLLNPLSAIRSDLVWHFPRVFEPHRVLDILFSYDGSSATVYLNGRPGNRNFRFGPGAVMVRPFRYVRTGELNAYNDIYYFLVFFPGGILLGLAAKTFGGRTRMASAVFLCAFLLLPVLLLEFVLVSVSGRQISFAYLALSIALAAGGVLWTSADECWKPA
jgi:hypothetical protein